MTKLSGITYLRYERSNQVARGRRQNLTLLVWIQRSIFSPIPEYRTSFLHFYSAKNCKHKTYFFLCCCPIGQQYSNYPWVHMALEHHWTFLFLQGRPWRAAERSKFSEGTIFLVCGEWVILLMLVESLKGSQALTQSLLTILRVLQWWEKVQGKIYLYSFIHSFMHLFINSVIHLERHIFQVVFKEQHKGLPSYLTLWMTVEKHASFEICRGVCENSLFKVNWKMVWVFSNLFW